MGEERNFRSQFYERVALREVEEKRTLEALLKEQPVDVKKLANFCQRSIVPAAYRNLVWKLLLHVVPRYAESHDYVRQQQTLAYGELWSTIGTLGLASHSDTAGDYFQDYHNHHNYHHHRHHHRALVGAGQLQEHKPGPDSPFPEHYLFMWLVSQAQLLHPPREQLHRPESQQFLAIVRKTSSFFDNPVDIFWVSSSLWDLLQKNQALISEAVQEAIGALRRENDILHHHLLRVGLFSSGLLMDLCLSLFCDIFPESAMEKVLDKVIAGGFGVLGCLAVALLLHLCQPLASVSAVSGVKSILSHMRKEEAEMVVSAALDQWLKTSVAKK